MTRLEFCQVISSAHPDWKVSCSDSGKAEWVDVVTTLGRWFTIEHWPGEGVGISEPKGGGLQLGGHDEAFDDFTDVLPYIESQLASHQ